LISGLGQVPFFIRVRFASTGQLFCTTNTHVLRFPNRHKLVQMANTVQGCLFAQAGVYLVELFCDGKWVADTTLELL
jgi:hypothetical protein